MLPQGEQQFYSDYLQLGWVRQIIFSSGVKYEFNQSHGRQIKLVQVDKFQRYEALRILKLFDNTVSDFFVKPKIEKLVAYPYLSSMTQTHSPPPKKI